jgi:hypothetical protein
MGNLGLPRSGRKPPLHLENAMVVAWTNLGLAGREKRQTRDGREEEASATKKQRSDTKNSDTSIPACQRHTPSCGERPKGDEQF